MSNFGKQFGGASHDGRPQQNFPNLPPGQNPGGSASKNANNAHQTNQRQSKGQSRNKMQHGNPQHFSTMQPQNSGYGFGQQSQDQFQFGQEPYRGNNNFGPNDNFQQNRHSNMVQNKNQISFEQIDDFVPDGGLPQRNSNLSQSKNQKRSQNKGTSVHQYRGGDGNMYQQQNAVGNNISQQAVGSGGRHRNQNNNQRNSLNKNSYHEQFSNVDSFQQYQEQYDQSQQRQFNNNYPYQQQDQQHHRQGGGYDQGARRQPGAQDEYGAGNQGQNPPNSGYQQFYPEEDPYGESQNRSFNRHSNANSGQRNPTTQVKVRRGGGNQNMGSDGRQYNSPNQKNTIQGKHKNNSGQPVENFLILPQAINQNDPNRPKILNDEGDDFDIQVRKYNSTVYDNFTKHSNGEQDNQLQDEEADIYAVRKSNSVMHHNNKNDERQVAFQTSYENSNFRQDEMENSSSNIRKKEFMSSMNSRSTGEIQTPYNQGNNQQYQPYPPYEGQNNNSRRFNQQKPNQQMSGSKSQTQLSQTQQFDSRSSHFSMPQPYEDGGYQTFQGRPSGGPLNYQHQNKGYQHGGQGGNFNDGRNMNQQTNKNQQHNIPRRNDRNSYPNQEVRTHQSVPWSSANNSTSTYHQSGRASNAGHSGMDAMNSANYFFDTFSSGLDTLYREPQDGMISLRKNPPDQVGKVFKDYDDGQGYIIKIPEVELITQIDLSTLWDEKQQFAGKIAMDLYRLNHPNLLNITRPIRYLDSHIQNGFLEICSECPSHISSWKSFCKRPFSLYQITSIFRQLTEGICHMHDQGLIFRDVHPTRIHMSGDLIKLNLVGMPYNFKKLLKNQSFSGHLNYSAPEILENGPENFLNPKVDVWSLGCCLYYLVTKRDPYDGKDPFQIKQNIRQGRLDRYQQHIGKDNYGNERHPIVQQLLQTCLDPNHQRRPNSRQLVGYIDHLILQNIDMFKQLEAEELERAHQKDQMSGNQMNQMPRVMNKHIPEFFVKHNNNEPIKIKLLPIEEILDKQNQESDESFSRQVGSANLTDEILPNLTDIPQSNNTIGQESNDPVDKSKKNLKIPDFNNINEEPTGSSNSQEQQNQNSWRLPQEDPNGVRLCSGSFPQNENEENLPNVDENADEQDNGEPQSTPKFRQKNQEENTANQSNKNNLQFPYPFQETNTSEEKNRQQFQDELDNILMNPNDSLSPTLPKNTSGDQVSHNGSEQKRELSVHQQSATNTLTNMDNSSYSSSAYRASIFKDSKLVYKKRLQREKKDGSERNKDVQGGDGESKTGQNQLNRMQSDEMSYNPISQDSPKKNQDNSKIISEQNASEELEDFNPTADGVEYENKNNSPTLGQDISKLTKELLSKTREKANSGHYGRLQVETGSVSDDDDNELTRMKSAPPDLKDDESHDDEYELNRMKSAPTNMKEEELVLGQMQSQHTESKNEDAADLNHLRVESRVNDDDNGSELERMQSAPADIFQTGQTAPISKIDARKNAKQPSKTALSSTSGQAKRVQKQINDHEQQSPSVDNEHVKMEEQKQAESPTESNPKDGEKRVTDTKQKPDVPQRVHLPIPQDNYDYIHSSSMGSGNTLMNQEMIDLVDNLIDSSPKTRGEIYDKGQFSLKIMPARDQGTSEKPTEQQHVVINDQQASKAEDPAVASNQVLSVGFLKYESGDVYEGQFLNGRRSGKGKMIFANGDKFSGMWHHDQMCDPKGFYQFKNGDEYSGSFKPCSQLLSRKNGCFDGPGTLSVLGKGQFVGNFKNHCLHGNGKFESLDGQIVIEKMWNDMSIEDFTDLIDKIVDIKQAHQ